ncbi:MAG TPA: hypothetical protein VFO99_17120, partial [Pyrinomonadaceae bacterium]|nr:hypothetical protein [Pyrinomonadaceae bacterium]
RAVANYASGLIVLRITTRIISTGDLALFVEGKLSGACVSELERCWRCGVTGESSAPAVVDLTDVSFIDSYGKQLLAQMHADGIKLVANGLMSKFVIDEIERA